MMKSTKIKNVIILGVISVLLTVSTNVLAQDQFIESDLQKDGELYEKYLSESYENTAEDNLAIENWMSDTDFWADHESNLTLEEWMCNRNFWADSEADLQIENWMLNSNFWNGDKESALKIESWMYDNSFWKEDAEESLNIQQWMYDKKFWLI